MASAATSPAIERVIELLETPVAPSGRRLHDGYLDLLGEEDPIGLHPGQRWMCSHTLPLVYERIWRPVGARVLLGGGAGSHREHRMAVEMLSLVGGESVLDVGCGPGNFTRVFARATGKGLVVGLDASRTMLARAVVDTDAANVAYVRADACRLPFRDGSFGAVSCFAALYLIENPMRALDEIVRVLAPGGHLALLSSCSRGPFPIALTRPLIKGLTGVRMFARDELTGRLLERRLTTIQQRVSGLGQFVWAQKPAV